MGDPLLKVRAGAPLAISADTINTLIDVARDARGNAMQIGAVGQNHRPGAKAVWILNTTTDHLKAGQVLGVDTAVQAKDLLIDEYLLKGVKPSRDHIDNFVVLLEPAAPNQVALAASDGLVMASIDWQGKDYCVAVGIKQDSYDLHAPAQSEEDEKTNGTTGGDVLTSDTRAMVLWAKDETGATTGLIRMWSYKKWVTPEPPDPVDHALLDGTVHPDTVYHDPVVGDLILAKTHTHEGEDDTVEWDALAVQGNGSVMVVNAGLPDWKAPPAGKSVFTFDGGAIWTAAGAAGSLFYMNAGGGMGWLAKGGNGSMLYVAAGAPAYLAAPAGFSVMTFASGVPTWKAPDDNDPALFKASGGAGSWWKVGPANSLMVIAADGSDFSYLWPPEANPGIESLLRFDATGHWSYFNVSPGKSLLGFDDNGALTEYYGDSIKMGILIGGPSTLEFSSPDAGPAVPWIDATNNVQWAKASNQGELLQYKEGVLQFSDLYFTDSE